MIYETMLYYTCFFRDCKEILAAGEKKNNKYKKVLAISGRNTIMERDNLIMGEEVILL